MKHTVSAIAPQDFAQPFSGVWVKKKTKNEASKLGGTGAFLSLLHTPATRRFVLCTVTVSPAFAHSGVIQR